MEQILIDSKHEYDYKLEGSQHDLYYSNDASWMSSGELAMSIDDDGNGISVMDEGKPLVYLDYHTAEMLSVLLRLINRERTYEVVIKRERI
jgi:hypothetical protein